MLRNIESDQLNVWCILCRIMDGRPRRQPRVGDGNEEDPNHQGMQQMMQVVQNQQAMNQQMMQAMQEQQAMSN